MENSALTIPEARRWAALGYVVCWIIGLILIVGAGAILINGFPGASRLYSLGAAGVYATIGLITLPPSSAFASRWQPLNRIRARAVLAVAVLFFGSSLLRFVPGAPKPSVSHGSPPALASSAAQPEPDASPPQPKSDPGEKWSDAAFVKDYVGKRLKDPDSAKFKDVWAFRSGPKLAYCGQVNSKNGFGGYSGFGPFVIADEGFAIGDAAILPALKVCEGGTRTSVPLE